MLHFQFIKVLSRVHKKQLKTIIVILFYFCETMVAYTVPDKAEAILQWWPDRNQDRSHERFLGTKRFYYPQNIMHKEVLVT